VYVISFIYLKKKRKNHGRKVACCPTAKFFSCTGLGVHGA
jgi:hypothetical protein